MLRSRLEKHTPLRRGERRLSPQMRRALFTAGPSSVFTRKTIEGVDVVPEPTSRGIHRIVVANHVKNLLTGHSTWQNVGTLGFLAEEPAMALRDAVADPAVIARANNINEQARVTKACIYGGLAVGVLVASAIARRAEAPPTAPTR